MDLSHWMLGSRGLSIHRSSRVFQFGALGDWKFGFERTSEVSEPRSPKAHDKCHINKNLVIDRGHMGFGLKRKGLIPENCFKERKGFWKEVCGVPNCKDVHLNM
jgi:hypothetical protein